MITLNSQDGAAGTVVAYAQNVWSSFPEHLYGVVMGIAYGGDVEAIGDLWKADGRGTVYGFDTFKDMHPAHLSADPKSREATCMESHYGRIGLDKLSYDYQRGELDKKGLGNVILVKGEVTEDSCKDIPEIHLAFLDMDILYSMVTGYAAVKDKIVKGGFLLLHDVTESSNLPLLHKWFYDDVLCKDKGMWEIEGLWKGEGLVCLRRVDK